MSKALIQQQAAKVLKERAEQEQLQQQLDAQQAVNAQAQAANNQAIAQVTNENNALRAEVQRLNVDLHSYEMKQEPVIVSPVLPGYEEQEHVTLSGDIEE